MNSENDKTILLVEDEPQNFVSEKKQLEGNGYNVILAHSGEQAVELVSKSPEIDLALVGIDSGSGEDGAKVAAQILKARCLPVVFLLSKTEFVEKIEQIDCYGYVLKNSGIEILVASIKLAFKLFDANEKIRKELTDFKQVGADLLESESKFRLLAENSTDMVSRHDPLGNYLYVSPACRSLLGYEPEELVGHSAFEFIHPNDIPTVEQSRESINRQPTVSTTTYRVRHKNGDYTWLETTSRSILDKDTGKVMEIHAATRDISERKRKEDALKESEERYSLLFQNLNSNFILHEIILDDNGKPCDYRFLALNAAAEEAVGMKAPAIVGKTAKELFPETEMYWIEKFGEVALTGVPIQYENYSKELNKYFEIRIYSPKKGQFALLGLDVTERRLAEEIVKQSEARYQSIVETSQDLIWQCDAEGRYTYLNPAWEKVFSYKIEEMLGKKFSDFQTPDVAERDKHEFERLMQGESVMGFETVHIGKSGNNIDLVFNAKSLLDDRTNKIIGTMGTAFDITERKQSEKLVRESEERYRTLVSSAPLVTFVLDENGMFMLSEGKGLEKLGLKPGQVVGLSAFDFYHDYPLITESIKGALQGKGSRDEVAVMNVVFDVAYIPIFDEHGKVVKVIGVANDITERKRAEEALQRSETLYRRAIEVADAVPYLQTYHEVNNISTQVDYDFIGEGIRQITGYGPEEFNEDLWDSIIQESVLQENLAAYSWNDAVHKVRSGDIPIWKCEHRIRARDGSIHWVLEAAVELRDENGVSHGSIGLFQDITARKQAEEALRLLNEQLELRIAERTIQLETANKELESFSYSVSHDLRAPLRAIDGYSRILQTEYAEQLSEDGRVLLDHVRYNANRMGALIDDLLKFSRLGRQPLDMQTIAPAWLIETALETLQAEREGRQVEIIVNDLPECQGDPSLLTQVWVNLLSNALKYTTKREFARIEIGCQPGDGGENVYYIKDNGIGFDMQYADNLFGVFQRLHADTDFEGTGVGLALVHRIIIRHGGRIWAYSQPDKGAAFYFVLGKNDGASGFSM